MADTMDLGKAGGGRAGTQRYVTGIIDPSSKWVHAEVFLILSWTEGNGQRPFLKHAAKW